MSTHSHLRTVPRLAAVAVATLLLARQDASATAEPPSPASGHAAVVAQGVVTFADGPFHWQIASVPVTASPLSIDASSPAFVVAEGPGAVVMSGAAGPHARLSAGEAVFVAADAPTEARTMSPAGGTALTLAVAAGPGDAATTFTPGASSRDVDLVRDVLNTNEALVLHAEVSALVVVTAGAVTTAGSEIPAGSSAVLTGDVTLINTAGGTATVLVALVGPSLDAGPTAAPTSEAPTPDQSSGANPAPPTNPPNAPEPTEAPSPEPTDPAPEPTEPEPEPEPDPMLDSDFDGLTDADEAGWGTDPLDSDTDNDGLSDGADRGNGCDPTAYDTDGDGFPDGSEVNAGTNCAVAD